MARKAPHRKTTLDADGTRRIVNKAPNGEAEPYWDEAKGRWRAPFYDPTTGRRRTVLGRTRAEADDRRTEKLTLLVATAPSGVLGPNPTIAQLADWWLTHVADVRGNTRQTYEKHCRAIAAGLGAVKVRDLTIEHLRLWMTEQRDSGLADATISNYRARLRQILEEAVTLGYLAANPVPKIKMPARKRERGTKVVLTPEQCHQLVVACARHDHGAAVATLFLVGNRASEVLGLAWSDFSQEPIENPVTGAIEIGTVASIQRGSTYLSGTKGRRGAMVLGPTKTVGTQGKIHIPAGLVALYDARRLTQDEDRRQAGLAWAPNPVYEGVELSLVFTDVRGRPLTYNRFRDALHDCFDLAGIPRAGIGTHAGRRSVITNLYGAGLDLSDVARFVGHSQTSTTAGYVQHLSGRPERTAAIAAKLLDPAAQD